MVSVILEGRHCLCRRLGAGKRDQHPIHGGSMKFKVDENLPVEAAVLLREAGHDAATVHDQNLRGALELT
jgi:hypothetical protein